MGTGALLPSVLSVLRRCRRTPWGGDPQTVPAPRRFAYGIGVSVCAGKFSGPAMTESENKPASRPRRRRPRAGKLLAAQLDAALQREADKLGKSLIWDEREAHHAGAACQAADHVELLQKRLDDEFAGDGRPTILVQLTSEIRLLNKQIGEHLRLLPLTDLVLAKSPQHARAASARWGAKRAPRRVG
jgi:hypothetical protein